MELVIQLHKNDILKSAYKKLQRFEIERGAGVTFVNFTLNQHQPVKIFKCI